MNFSPNNYSFKNNDIRTLERISQIDGNLQVLRMNPDWAQLLEREARLEEAVSSIGVEGTVISIEQAKAITVGESTSHIGEKEKREFESYYKSLEFIRGVIETELTISLLLTIHEKITQGDKKALPGKLRIEQNAVRRDGKIVYIPPPTNQLNFLLKEFLLWFRKTAKDKNISPIVAAAICHFWFVWIHPFADGNGRTARILTSLLLLKKKAEGIKYFALSDYYNRHQNEYYNVLKVTNKCDPNSPSMNFSGDLSPWVSFFISSYFEQAKQIREITNRILQFNIRVGHLRKSRLITQKQDGALRLLSSQEKASYEELRKYLGGISLARVNQILQPMRKAGILAEEKIGKRMWFRLGLPENEPNEGIFKRKLKPKSGDKLKRYPLKQGVLPIFKL